MEWLRNFWRRHVVAPLPEDMTICGSCDRTRCDETRFRTCPDRLKAVETKHPNENAA